MIFFFCFYVVTMSSLKNKKGIYIIYVYAQWQQLLEGNCFVRRKQFIVLYYDIILKSWIWFVKLFLALHCALKYLIFYFFCYRNLLKFQILHFFMKTLFIKGHVHIKSLQSCSNWNITHSKTMPDWTSSSQVIFHYVTLVFT